VFGLLKQRLREIQTNHRETQDNGQLPHLMWIQCFDEVIREVLVHRDWSMAFAGNGLGSTTTIRRTLQELWGPAPFPAVKWPTDAELAMLCGRSRPCLAPWLFSGTDRPEPELPLPPVPPPEELPSPEGAAENMALVQRLARQGSIRVPQARVGRVPPKNIHTATRLQGQLREESQS
jgi:hypothetical protein